MADASEKQNDEPNRGLRLTFKVSLTVLVLALLLPFLLGKTALRNVVLNSIVDSDKLTLHSTGANLGYFTPISVSGLSVQSKDKETKVSFREIAADRSWLSMLFSRPELGNFRFDSPDVDITVRKTVSEQEVDGLAATAPPNPTVLPNLTAEIVDASIVVRMGPNEPPPIDLSGISAHVRLERKGALSVLVLEPTVVFDHQPLTPQLCGQGLQLIAPLLADEVSATGEFSLNLTQCEIPVASHAADIDQKANAINVKGQLDLHSASVSVKNTIASKLMGTVMQLVGISLPNALTVAENVTVEFAVIDGRVHHSGLALLLPQGDSSIEIVSSGSVGLDETLDLLVSIKLPDGLLGKGVVREALTEKPLQLAISGTLEKPQLRLAGNKGFLQSMSKLIESAGKEGDETNSGEVADASSDLLGGLLDLVKERAANKKRTKGQTPADTQPQEPSTGRTRLLPFLRGKEGGKEGGGSILPGRNRHHKNDGLPTAPQNREAAPAPPAPGSPSASVPTPI